MSSVTQSKKHSEFPMTNSDHMHAMMECMSTCVTCSMMCLKEGHKTTAALCSECADICALAIKAMSGNFHSTSDIMELCSSICYECGEECKRMKSKHCQECADVCMHCSEACSSAM